MAAATVWVPRYPGSPAVQRGVPPVTDVTAAGVIRAAVYQRVSSNLQNDRRQDYENDQAVARYGWQATRYREPKGISASRFGGKTREVWNAIREGIVSGQIDVVVLHEVSRGQRRLTEWSAVLDACRRHGVRIYLTSRDRMYDVAASADDWEALATAGIRSAMESETLSERIQSGKDQGMREGRPQGSVPYGIHRVRDPEKVRTGFLYDEPDPVTGPVAARIIREYGAYVPAAEIAAGLDRDGVPAPGAGGRRGERWSPTTITRIAGNPYYASPAALDGYPVRPVVTVAESERAIRRVRAGQLTGERPSRQDYRYSQLMTCGRCGANVRGKIRGGRPRYVCENGHGATLALLADRYIDELAIGYLSDPGLVAKLNRKDTGEIAAAARAEAAGYRRKISEAAGSYAAGRITIGALEAVTADLEPKAKAAGKRAADAERPPALAGLADESREIVAARWEALSVAGRKAALRIIAPDAKLMPAGRGPSGPVSQRVILWPPSSGS